MAFDQGTKTLSLKTEERTFAVVIETPKGGDPKVTVHREIASTAPDGTVVSREPAGTVTRFLSATAKQSFEVAGKSYATAEIAGVIAAIADQWRTEDIAAEAEQLLKFEQRAREQEREDAALRAAADAPQA